MGLCFERGTLLLLVPIWVVARLVAFRVKNRNGFSLKKEVLLSAFFVYILCLLDVTLFPFQISFDGSGHGWVSVNLIPIMNTLSEIKRTTSDPYMQGHGMVGFWIKNIAGNIILLSPLGLMAPMLWKNKFTSAVKTTALAFCLSLSIEITQLTLSHIGGGGRAFDIDDVLLNAIGAFIGYVLYKKIKTFLTKPVTLS